MFIVRWVNAGGEMDSRMARDGKHVMEQLRAMIEEAGELADGDTFEIEESE